MEIGSDDFIREERRWQEKQQERKDKEARYRRDAWTERTAYICMAVGTILVTATIVFALWKWASEASRNDTSRINACSASGGTWTTIGGGSEKMCIKMGVETPK